MLESEDGGGYKDGSLLAVGGGLEGGSHSHFRLTEAYVAADKAIHRHRAFHIAFDIGGGFGLIGGVFVEERGFEFVLHIAVGHIGKAFLLLAFGIESDEVACDVFDLVFGAFAQAFPCP